MKKLVVIMMKIARNKYMAAGVSFMLRRFVKFLPVEVIAKDSRSLMLRHPKPAYELHYLVIPRKRIVNIQELLKNEKEYLNIANFICDNVCIKDKIIICNFGERQEVKQVHFHVVNINFDEKQKLKKNCDGKVLTKMDESYYVKFELIKETNVMKSVIEKAIQENIKGFSVIWY